LGLHTLVLILVYLELAEGVDHVLIRLVDDLNPECRLGEGLDLGASLVDDQRSLEATSLDVLTERSSAARRPRLAAPAWCSACQGTRR
jgi:hypothetical protein